MVIGLVVGSVAYVEVVRCCHSHGAADGPVLLWGRCLVLRTDRGVAERGMTRDVISVCMRDRRWFVGKRYLP